jgi:hypothetical protein
MSNLEVSAPPVWATWDVRSCRGPGGSSSRKVRGVQSGAKAQLDRSTAGEALAAKNRVISGAVKATRNRPSPEKPTESDDEGSTHGSLEPREKPSLRVCSGRIRREVASGRPPACHVERRRGRLRQLSTPPIFFVGTAAPRKTWGAVVSILFVDSSTALRPGHATLG